MTRAARRWPWFRLDFLDIEPRAAFWPLLTADFSSASQMGLGKQFIAPVLNLIILHDAFQKERV